MAPGYSVAVSLCDIGRTLLKEVVAHPTDETPDPQAQASDDVAAVRQWLDTEKSREWVAENVVGSQSFTDIMTKNPPATVRSILQTTLAQIIDDSTTPGSPPLHAVRNVLEMLSQHWNESELLVDGANPAPSVAAVRKAYEQLPMLRAVRQALSMFPVDVAAKLDKQAAEVGESIRKTGKTNPADVIGSVMANPQFMAMMEGMMKPEDDGPSAEALQYERDIDARFRMIELRIKKLEGAPPTGKQGKRNPKKNSTRASNAPTY